MFSKKYSKVVIGTTPSSKLVVGDNNNGNTNGTNTSESDNNDNTNTSSNELNFAAGAYSSISRSSETPQAAILGAFQNECEGSDPRSGKQLKLSPVVVAGCFRGEHNQPHKLDQLKFPHSVFVAPLAAASSYRSGTGHHQEIKLESQTEREKRFLGVFSTILLVSQGAGTLMSVALFLSSISLASASQPVSGLIGTAVCLAARWGSRPQASLRALRLGSWTLLSFLNLELGLALVAMGPAWPTPAGFFITLLLGLFLLPWWGTLLFSVGGVGLTIVLTVLSQLGSYQPQIEVASSERGYVSLALWVIFLSVPTAIGIYFSIQLRKANQVAFDQNTQLSQAVENIEEKRQVEAVVSHQIKTATTELHAAANEQAAGSVQQELNLREITSSLNELTEAAAEISTTAEKVNSEVFDGVLAATSRVSEATTTVMVAGEEGLAAMTSTVASALTVGTVYSRLVDTLTELAEQSTQIKKVMRLVGGVADTIHHLSLNAAIEAAKAGQDGERFKVVAQQVKALATNSQEASQEIGAILSQVERGIYQATDAARDGAKEAELALANTYVAEQTFKQLCAAIEQNQAEVGGIEQSMSTMRVLLTQTDQATSRQHLASSQVLAALQQLGTVARQSTSSSQTVAEIAADLELLSTGLNQNLADG